MMSSKKHLIYASLFGFAAVGAYFLQAQPTALIDPPPPKASKKKEPRKESQNVAIEKSSVPPKPATPARQADMRADSVEPQYNQPLNIEPWEVALTRPSDEEFSRFIGHLRQDPIFLAGVMQEFQSETDPERSRWLAFMLGDLRDKPELTALAGQMLFSGDQQSTLSALVLLSRLQKSDPAARDLVLQSLSASQDLTILTASMNALARATPDISYAQSEQMLQQLSPLTLHPVAKLRRRSYDLLFRWASDTPYISQLLVKGLIDIDPKVRRTTAIGFIDYPQPDTDVKLALMDMLNSDQELDRNRSLAASALQKLELNPDEELHIKAVLKKIR